MFSPSLTRWFRARSQSSRRVRRRNACLGLLRLEDRVTPTVNTVSWINPAGGDWDTPGNWSGGQVPGANDDVVINYGMNDFTVTHSGGSDAINRLTSEASFAITGGTFSI